MTSQALRIDGRSGVLKAVGSALVATRSGKPMRAARGSSLAMTAVATVPLNALKLYGNTAVFTTLPPSTLGRRGVEVKIGLGSPGEFSKVPLAGADAIPTITVPPAIKDRATLHRYSEAFKQYQRVVVPPASSVVDRGRRFRDRRQRDRDAHAHRCRSHRAIAPREQLEPGRADGELGGRRADERLHQRHARQRTRSSGCATSCRAPSIA